VSALVLAPVLLLMACPQQDAGTDASGPSALEQKAIEKGCPTMGTLPGDYILVQGNSPDHKNRFRILEEGQGLSMWYVDGGFTRRVMKGELREHDYKFVEVPDDRKKAAFEAGNEPLKVVYVEPRLEKCALRVSKLELSRVDGKDVEKGSPLFLEYVSFPKTQPIAWAPCDGDLFLYDAAKSYGTAKKQLDELGWPKVDHPLGEAIPAAAWSDAAADGDAACTYDMDLYFDDLPVAEGTALAAGDVTDGMRHWFVPAWKAPYSGNHHFEIHRYRTCDGKERQRIGVNCLEAVLN